jgi:hypothetical protein
MRKRLVAIALACLVVGVVAPSAVPKTPKQDSAFGSGVRAPSCSSGCPVGTFSFNATSGPNGENPNGTFAIDFNGFAAFTANVTCLHVSGHTATLVGQISRGTGAADLTNYTDPVYYVAVVRDNGQAKPHQPSPDQMSLVSFDTEAGWNGSGFTLAELCSDPLNAIGDSTMFGLVAGELTVIDK